MSGANDDRWRPARGQQHPPSQNQNRQNNQQRRNQSRDGGQGPNAWQSAERSGKDGASQGPPQEQHVPVERFNGQEIRDMLKHAFNSLSAGDAKAARYKAPPAGQTNSAKSGGPWGSKPNTMGNGKDFFLEIRKQVSALQQGTERAGG